MKNETKANPSAVEVSFSLFALSTFGFVVCSMLGATGMSEFFVGSTIIFFALSMTLSFISVALLGGKNI